MRATLLLPVALPPASCRYHQPPLGRLYRVGLLFLVLIFSATYTANLAAFLTRPTFVVHGPQTVDALREATACCRWTSGVFIGFADSGWVGKLLTPPENMPTQDREPWARDMLHRGECSAIVEIGVNAKRESLMHCDSMYLAPSIEIMPIQDYNLMRENDVDAWRDVSDATLKVLGSHSYNRMVRDNLKFDQSCDNHPGAGTDKITVKQMEGAFIIFGACGLLAVVLTALHRGATPPAEPGVIKMEVQNEKLDAKLDCVLAQLRAIEARSQKAVAFVAATGEPGPGLGLVVADTTSQASAGI